MKTIVYTTINLLLFSTWYVFLFRKKDSLSFSDRLSGTFILGLTQIITTEMVLGLVFKQLFTVPLFLLNFILSLGILVLSLTKGLQGSITGEIRDETARMLRIVAGDRILLTLFSLFLLSLCYIIFLGYLFPSYSWDALWYHLPIVGNILQSGALQDSPVSSFSTIGEFANIFPKNMELFFLWNIIFLKSDVIVDLSQLFFTVTGVFILYSIAVKLGIKEKYAVYSSLLFFFTPVIMLQSSVNYVDIATSILFLAALNFLMCRSPAERAGGKRGSESNQNALSLLLAGLSAGILLGSKGSGPLFVAVLMAAAVLQEFVKYYSGRNDMMPGYFNAVRKEKVNMYLFYYVMPMFLMGGYWYIKNWISYGNPVYPQELSFFNVTVFSGIYKDVVIDTAPEVAGIKDIPMPLRLFHVWLEKAPYYIYDSRLSGFGPLWFILFLPASVFAILLSMVRRNFSLLFLSVTLIVMFLIYPSNWNTRYVIFIVGLGALSFGFLLNCFQRREKVLTTAAFIIAVYTFMTANSPLVMPSKIKEFLSLPRAERTLTRYKPFCIDVFAREKYGHWIWIEKNIGKGDTVAHSFTSSVLDTSDPFFSAPLWNGEFTSKVVYMQPREYREWLHALIDAGVNLVVYKKHSREDEWIEKERKLYYSLRWMGGMAEKFRIEYDDDLYRIARFVREVE